MKALLPLLLALPASLASSSALAAQAGQAAEEEGAPVLVAPGIESLTIGGQLRFRVESRDPFPPVDGAPSESVQLGRIRVNLDARFDENLSAFVELQESLASQGATSTSLLHQAFANLNNLFEGSFDVQVGRFEMVYGNQRMVSPLDWSNLGRAWDGVRLVRRGESYQFDAFATQPAGPPHVTALDSQDDFYGLYLSLFFEWFDADFYAFKRQLMAGFDDYTYGALLEGAVEQLSWSVEGAFQSGDHGALDASGFAVAARADADVGSGFQLGAGYELATGADGNDDAFVPLYNFSHAYQGHQDLVAWSNLQDVVVRSRYAVDDQWNVHGDLHFLSKHEDNDVVRFGPGAAGAASVAGQGDIGTEIDLYLKGKMGSQTSVWVGVSRFFAGDAILNGDDQLWYFVQAAFDF